MIRSFCGILTHVMAGKNNIFSTIYQMFNPPISQLDCGKKCSPYNEYGIPFCCDTCHIIPTAYAEEWKYLQKNTNLWHLWEPNNTRETNRLQSQMPDDQVLIECLGHDKCIRDFRAITCRAFPFFPYINKEGLFIGLTYYWQYENRCWVISNLDQVSRFYRDSFIKAYTIIFDLFPDELENYRYHSIIQRRVFGRKKKTIPLLHRNGNEYLVSSNDSRMVKVEIGKLPKFGPYQIAEWIPFPDEKRL